MPENTPKVKLTPEERLEKRRERHREYMKKYRADPANLEKERAWQRGRSRDPEQMEKRRERHREYMRKRREDPEYREYHRAYHREYMRKRYQDDPEYRQHCIDVACKRIADKHEEIRACEVLSLLNFAANQRKGKT